MAIADLPDPTEVARHGRQHPCGRAAHGLGDEADDLVRAQSQDGGLKLGREAFTILLGRFTGGLIAIRIAG